MAGYDDNAIFLWNCDGADGATADQTATTGQNIELFGTAQLDTADPKFGTAALLLDGNSDYGKITDSSSSLKLLHAVGTTGKWTIDGWFKFASFAAEQQLFDSSAGSSDNVGIRISLNTDRTFDVIIFRGVTGTYVIRTLGFGTYPNDNNWHHIEISYDQALASANCEIFVDGTSVGTGNKTGSGASAANSTYDLSIGALNTPSVFLNGSVDEIRISDVVRHTDNFTPPTEAYSEDSAVVPLRCLMGVGS